MKLAIQIRPAVASDFGYIVHSGRRELAQAKVFGPAWKAKAEKILAGTFDALCRGGAARVACDSSDTSTILGWALFGHDGRTLLYVYVSHAVRRQGIAKLLTEKKEP